MTILKRALILCTIILTAILLASCGITTPAPTATVITLPSLTPSVTPTGTQPSQTLSPTSTPSSKIISSAPDGLLMAYVFNGNLYFQNGGKPPLQLTRGGEDWQTIAFSEGVNKILFFRGMVSQEIYSINVDGSKEQALITNNQLLKFGTGYDKSTTPCDPVLVPHTQFLLFSTCSHPDEYTTIRNSDLFIADTDTNIVKVLFPRGQGGKFYVSPDGNMLAIDRQNSIDILDINGKLIHRKIATYPRSEPISVSALLYWTSDSSALILALPINTIYDTSQPPTYAIWRYSPGTNSTVQVNLDPPPMSNEKNWISPDGHWITYINFNEGFFIGNLQQGETQPYPNPSLPHEWSPDSTHFVYETFSYGKLVLYLASVNAHPALIGDGEFLGWLDASKYLYYTEKTFIVGEIGKEPMPILVGNTQPLFPGHPDGFIFTYQP